MSVESIMSLKTSMSLKKIYTFSKTPLVIANVIAKMRSMQSLTPKEELVYLVHVKQMSEEQAKKMIEARPGDTK